MQRIFIGFDHRQPIAYNVLQYSIVARASRPVSITPLVYAQLPVKRRGLTPFAFSRFLVPWLCGYQGVALFLDTDMLVQADIADLFDLMDDSAVMVVKHALDYEWASLMLFNCAHPDNRVLTPEYIETAEHLHRISWTDKSGELPGEWNHLVMYDRPEPARILHYTAGIPCFPETKDLGYAKEWLDEFKAVTSTHPWRELMGHSKHAKPVLDRFRRSPPPARGQG
jgi:hypothetical protein